MTELPIPAPVIEAAARAIWHRQVEVVELDEVEAALRAAFDELGMMMARDKAKAYGENEPEREIYRFVSRWFQDEPGEGS